MSAISQVSLYGRIEKVEEQSDGTIMVHGIASTEAEDSVGETVTAKAMRDSIPEYLRFPTIREMHQLSAVGRSIEVDVGDDNITRVVAHVIDPAAINKVKKKIYSGFSIGGKVTKRNNDNRKVIEGISLTEISLVDRPANPDSVIEMWKADGFSVEEDPEAELIDPNAAEEVSKRDFDAKQRRSDAKDGSAMKDGSFPIKDKEDLHNAIRLAGNAKNPGAARAHIKRRAAALGASDMIPSDWKDGAKKAEQTGAAADPVDKTVVADQLKPNRLVDVLNDHQASMNTAANTPVLGSHVEVTLPGNGPEKAVEVKNPEEAGQAHPRPLNPTDTPVVEHVAPAAATPGKDERTNKDAADDAGAVSPDEAVDDPVAVARSAADAALKAATAVLNRLSKRETGISPVLAPGAELRKGLHATARLGCLLCELAYCLSDAQLEKDREGDNSGVPAKLHSAVGSLAAAYRAMSDEELQELLDAADETMSVQIALAASGGNLAKALDGVLDAAAIAKVAGATGGEALAKAEDRITALEGERDDLLKTVGGLTDTMTALSAKVETMADTPMPAKTIGKAADPALISVSKEQDASGSTRASEQMAKAAVPTEDDVRKALAEMSEDERAMLLMKASLSPINARLVTR